MPKLSDDEVSTILTKLLDKTSETHAGIASLDKKLDLHILKTEYELSRIKDTDDVQNKLLDEHIEGVQTLKKLFEVHEKADNDRLLALEAPRHIRNKIIVGLFKAFITIGAIASAAAGIMKLLHII